MTPIGNGGIPKDKTGGVSVNIQDQITRPIIAKFNKVSNSTALSVAGVENAYEITVDDTTGFVAGKYIILFDPASANFSFYKQVGAPAGNVITLDTPLDFNYPTGTFVDVAGTNLAVDGSVTPQVFGLRGTGAPPGVDVTVDITRIIFYCLTDDLVDLSKFADIAGGILNGLVLRTRNGTVQNIFNVKTNAEMAGLMYDFNIQAASNPSQGQNGFIARLTFAGQEKIGVAIRLPIGDDLEFLVQDNLSSITEFSVIAEGHLLQD